MPATVIQNHHRGGSRKLPPPCADLVRTDFTADRPGSKFVANIIYNHVWQGFIYLATVVDCYSKKVVGWAIEDHMRSELVERALRNATSPARIEQNAIFHSDRGRVHTLASFRALVTGLGNRSSMGKTKISPLTG